MSFTERSKTIALAIVKIFETSKPFGRYDAVAVLNDGAGISYGTSQFTHRSGSLAKVITRYLKLGGSVGSDEMAEHLPQLKSGSNILALSKNAELKKALKEAGNTPEMQQAQREIAFENYLKPALEACEGSDFDLPLSLAVIYDSLNHGSYAKIRDKVKLTLPPSIKPDEYEKEWITQYTQKRDKWLESMTRLAATDYRTDFFLAQIARNNWQLKLPMTVHGFRLTDEILFPKETFADLTEDEIILDIPTISATATATTDPTSGELEPPAMTGTPSATSNDTATPAVVDPVGLTQNAENIVNTAPPLEPEFVPETMAVTAPPPTGFLNKLKAQGAAILAAIGGAAGLKEWFGIQLSQETADLLKILIPSVLGLGFIGFVVWFVTEKIVGYKTLQLKATLRTDPTKHNIVIIPGDPGKPWYKFWG